MMLRNFPGPGPGPGVLISHCMYDLQYHIFLMKPNTIASNILVGVHLYLDTSIIL